MIHPALRASQLAIKFAKPRFFPANTLQTFPSITASDHRRFTSISRKNPGEYVSRHLPKRIANISSVRNCSYQRNMCRAHEDVVGGSVDVTKGREVLPTNVKPIHYDLTLEPDFEKFSFEGKVVIEYV